MISSKASPNTNTYTFLYSDSSCIPNTQQTEQDLAVKHDRFAHTRTKRKRTSPKDFAVLEAEYQNNAKPDRATRISLANRVALTEKEVQVWFQNRRQMTRKKRGTWQPNEITSIIRSSQDHTKSTASPSISPSSSFEGGSRFDGQSQHDHNERSGSQSSIGEADIKDGEDAAQNQTENTSREGSQASQESSISSQDTSSGILEEPVQSSAKGFSPRKLKRTSSMVRLAMSLDGKASVIIRGQTPSPPNKTVFSNPLGRAGLQRSQSLITAPSAIATQENVALPVLSVSRLPGRSRDTRNWEFWCDSERRESLTKSAEIDLRGSAAGPISLLRSSSSKKGASVQKKRKPEETLNEQRPKLSRTKSSSARLQSSQSDTKNVGNPKNHPSTIYVDGSDSDKENVDPNASTTVPAPRRFVIPRMLGNKRQVLRENTNMPSHSTSLGVLLEKEKQNTSAKSPHKRGQKATVIDKENIEIDSEVAGFMKSGGNHRETEDLDAVKNLLRLSQGAWQ